MLQQLKNRKQQGFTIIEVLIVLAIAGLIMLVVFLAVPALQRNARNNTRTSEASRISAALTDCLANRNGTVSGCDTTAEINVGTLQEMSIVNASISTTTTRVTAANQGSTSVAEIWYNAICDPTGATPTTTGGTPKSFAVVYKLEPAVDKCISSN